MPPKIKFNIAFDLNKYMSMNFKDRSLVAKKIKQISEKQDAHIGWWNRCRNGQANKYDQK